MYANASGRRADSIKLAIFHFGFMYSGGGERTSITEASLLAKKGHLVKCFSPAVRSDVCFPDLIRDIDVEGFLPRLRVKIPMRDFASLALSSVLVRFIARRFSGYDVILCHGQPSIWIGHQVTRFLEQRYVSYLHQPARFLYPRDVDLKFGWSAKTDLALLNSLVRTVSPIVRMIDYVSVRGSVKVLVNSKWIAGMVRKIYGIRPLVCPPGVDLQRFKPVGNKQPVKVGGFRISRPFILTTNRHYPQKGMDYLIEVLPAIAAKTEAKLVATGEPTNYTARMIEMANKLNVRDRIVFTGRVNEDELTRLYQNADAYVYPSPCEDFGLGPIEAMACGTPVVVWDYAGPAETVLEAKTGFKVRPYDLNEFASKVVRLITDTRLNEEMRTEAVEHVKKNFTWERHLKILTDVLLSSI